KIFGFTGRLLSGLRWTGKLYAEYPIAVALLVAALVWLRDRRLQGGALLFFLFSAYTVYVGGDSFEGFRFFAPIIALFIVTAAAAAWRLDLSGAEAWVARATERMRPWLEVTGMLVGLAIFVAAAILWPVRSQERFLRQAAVSFAGALGLGLAAI